MCESLLAACREIGGGEAVGNGEQGNDRLGDPAVASKQTDTPIYVAHSTVRPNLVPARYLGTAVR